METDIPTDRHDWSHYLPRDAVGQNSVGYKVTNKLL